YYPPDHEYREKVGTNRTYRYMTTPSMKIGDVEELNSATLEFQNRYRATEGTAGGFIYLWGKNDQSTDWVWNKSNRLYVEPEQSYTGNLNFARIDEQNEEGGPNITGHEGTGDLRLEDREGNIPYWVFNGKSADRTFDWRHTSVNVGRHEDFLKDHDEVRAVFMFAQFGGITREDGWEPEMGWYIDDVRFKASYEWDEDGPGHWKLTNAEGLEEEMGIDINPEEDDEYHDHTLGTEEGHYWIFTSKDNDGNDKLPQGVDSSLYTHPIYLEKAEDPRLSAYMKFNLEDDGEESPPDGFRVEISSDDGRTWQSLTSGNRPTAGTSGDSGYGWKNLDTLSKLNVDLSAWKGEIIRLRFRVFTNTTENNNNDLPKAIFIDDVVVAEADMGIGTSEETSSLQSQETVMTANLEEEAEEEQDESEPESLRMERSTPLDINQMVEATYYQRSTIAFESLTKLVYW
ncbi:MAG: hypothetical protein KGY68_05200, partial [Candidatus Thermoplasmatota archaeon]|nr:hypothetical protein [Candidatus Thermoplasmatota archaeon]